AICSTYYLSTNMVTFHNVKMLKISDCITTDQGLIALLKVPNLESLIFDVYMTDEVKDSDEDEENDSDNVQGHGDYNNEDDDTDSVEADNNHDNEDEGDVAVSAECIWNDKCQDNYDSEDNSWELNIVTTGCLLPQLKSVFFQEFAGNPREMKWVRLILKYAKALQKKEYPLLRSL
ncbi:hypothetical protein MKW98_031129, partial [Papaver atlanticum]